MAEGKVTQETKQTCEHWWRSVAMPSVHRDPPTEPRWCSRCGALASIGRVHEPVFSDHHAASESSAAADLLREAKDSCPDIRPLLQEYDHHGACGVWTVTGQGIVEVRDVDADAECTCGLTQKIARFDAFLSRLDAVEPQAAMLNVERATIEAYESGNAASESSAAADLLREATDCLNRVANRLRALPAQMRAAYFESSRADIDAFLSRLDAVEPQPTEETK